MRHFSGEYSYGYLEYLLFFKPRRVARNFIRGILALCLRYNASQALILIEKSKYSRHPYFRAANPRQNSRTSARRCMRLRRKYSGLSIKIRTASRGFITAPPAPLCNVHAKNYPFCTSVCKRQGPTARIARSGTQKSRSIDRRSTLTTTDTAGHCSQPARKITENRPSN